MGPLHYGKDLRSFDRAACSRLRTTRIEAAMNVASQLRKEHTMSKTNNAKKLPAYRVYAVTKKDENESDWFEIGAAWSHENGKGLSLRLKALPLAGAQIVLREPKPQTQAE
jgi:hypothetical protein